MLQSILGHCETSLDSRPLLNSLQPLLQVGVWGDIDAGVAMNTNPTEGLDVGDAVLFSGEPLVLFEVALEDRVETLGLVQVTVDGIWAGYAEMLGISMSRK